MTFRYTHAWLAALALALALSAGAALPASAQGGTSTSILVFPVDGDEALARGVTQALKASLKQGGNVYVTEFQPDLPSLRRAVTEGSISRSQFESKDRDVRRKIASAIGASFYFEGRASLESGTIAFNATAVQVANGRAFEFESSYKTGEGAGTDTSSLILSVGNTVATQFITQVLRSVPPAAPIITTVVTPPDSNDTEPDNTTPAPSNPAPPSAPAPAPGPTPSRDVTRYIQQSESLVAAGDVAGAIQSLRDGVNVDPGNVELRLRLADLYRLKGMDGEAEAELKRAAELGGSTGSGRVALAQRLEAAGSLEQAAGIYRELLAEEPRNTQLRVAYGDLLWNLGQPDQASLEYAQASRDNPSASEPHRRLARLFASRGEFLTAMISLETARRLDETPETAPLEPSLYRSLVQSADVAYYRFRDECQEAERKYQQQDITREQYFQTTRSLITRIEELTEFLGDITPPAGYQAAVLHRTLAGSLLSQSVTALQDWLIKNDDALQQQARRFAGEADAQMDQALEKDRQARARERTTSQ